MAKRHYHSIEPDEIFLDSSNLPKFNEAQFEGRLEKPIHKSAFLILFLVFILVLTAFFVRVANLQLVHGQEMAERSLNNTLRKIPIFAERGLITDRRGTELAWNDQAGRQYTPDSGFGLLLGYIGYPTDEELKAGDYAPKELVGRAGVEKYFNSRLAGGRGLKIEEVDVGGQIKSEHVFQEPTHGEAIQLSIDARLEHELAQTISKLITDGGSFVAGAGVVMDVETGEVLALTSWPEYDPNVLSRGADRAQINSYLNNKNQPFLNRVVKGLYTPGSIVKPVMALGALTEKVITPEKQIFSSGILKVPNPYSPGQFSTFRDWQAQGWVDMRHAIAKSSDIYFYEVGGGFEGQKGMGITNIDKYTKLFGYSQPTGINLEGEESGVIPTPDWKAKTFPDDPDWRLGNTYHTVIGQYGFQVTPLQVVRTIAAVATSGRLVTPTVLKLATSTAPTFRQIPNIPPENYQVVREGMRLSAEEGTAAGLNTSAVAIAAKTGTAEVGVHKEFINSWSVGFFPYEKPRYAFAVVMERGKAGTTIGATYVMRQLIDWMAANTPEYFTID